MVLVILYQLLLLEQMVVLVVLDKEVVVEMVEKVVVPAEVVVSGLFSVGLTQDLELFNPEVDQVPKVKLVN